MPTWQANVPHIVVIVMTTKLRVNDKRIGNIRRPSDLMQKMADFFNILMSVFEFGLQASFKAKYPFDF